MFIKKISICNFRIYKGLNSLEFNRNSQKNLFIVAGNNGYGKTSFLTSLVWCLYGKKISEIEDAYRKDIFLSGGYKNYIIKNLNTKAYENNEKSYYVELTFSNFNIPFLNSEEVIIKREYNIDTDKEILSIIIDGYENELTKEVGPEIFINDFILPKEIAKFFFFDSEKIVDLAENLSTEEKRNISIAYSEVLGIKKYEDLRENLKELRLRFKRESAGIEQKRKFDLLQKEISEFSELKNNYEEKIKEFNEEKELKIQKANQIQEKLIREGQSLSIEELNILRKENLSLLEKNRNIKKSLNDLFDLIPFALLSGKMKEIALQIELENKKDKEKELSEEIVIEKLNTIFSDKDIKEYLLCNVKNKVKYNYVRNLKKLIKEKFSSNVKNIKSTSSDIIHFFTIEEQNEFFSIYNTVNGFFNEQFNKISDDYKQNQLDLRRISRKLSNAEKKEDDLIISSYRTEKELFECEIHNINENIIKYLSQIETINRDINVKQRQIAELSKYIQLNSDNISKDKISSEVIEKLDDFIVKFKKEKKEYLEKRILSSLKILMHKKNFISRVRVNIENELIDINLYNHKNEFISKNILSKGEQQLYVTAILKALVEESNIKFPVFIDSPLQKFDTKHSKNIIHNFYPAISEQVVICPLLEKELTEKEYGFMKNNIESAYLIINDSEEESYFEKVNPKELFSVIKKQTNYVL